MKRLGLKYISSLGVNFPAVNSGKWNLATNFKGNFSRILTECGIDADDYESVALYVRYIEKGMLLCAARRFFPVSEQPSQFQALWMFVPEEVIISKADLSKAALELVGIFNHPEAFTSFEAFEDIIPAIFRKDFEEVESEGSSSDEEETAAEEAGKKLEREIFEVLSKIGEEGEKETTAEPARIMTGERIGYVGYENRSELEILLSFGFIPQYAHFGLVYLTDYPVRVEALLPGIFHPEILKYRREEQERLREEEIKKLREEALQEEKEKEHNKETENTEQLQENSSEYIEQQGAEEMIAPGEAASESEMASIGEDPENGEGMENDSDAKIKRKQEEASSWASLYESREKWNAERDGQKKKDFSMLSFWAGFIAASILYLLIYMVVELSRI